MSLYSVLPQNVHDDLDDDQEDETSDVDLEIQSSSLERSIVSITVSRKEKPDGTLVRIKETFLSDGTSYQEETPIPQRTEGKHTVGSDDDKPSVYYSPRSHSTNQMTRHKNIYAPMKPRKHSMQFLPTNVMDGRPEPLIIKHNARLPQSKDPRARLIYYLFCRCTFLLSMLLLFGSILAWFLLMDDPVGALQSLLPFSRRNGGT
mmetsp:Transcript_17135/g.27791  ORF Transcript_17135/g.27791 Transcript_17135/m.27791 type:complete len:204 (-) Transcript_17135:420-1031(-)